MILPWEDMEILVGDSVPLFAQYWPDNCSVKWLVNTTEIPANKYTVDPGSSQLTLENLQESSDISVIVTSPVSGKIASNKCNVVVHVIPIEIVSKSSDCSFALGDNGNLFVEFKSDSKVVAEWFLNGKLKSKSTNITIVTTSHKSQVIIENFSKDLIGQWSCVLSDDLVSLQHSFQVSLCDLKPKPQSPLLKLGQRAASRTAAAAKILKQLENCSVKEGKSLKLECQISQNISSPEIFWFHESSEISSDNNTSISYSNGVSSLVISKVNTDHGGSYTCKIRVPTSEELTSKCSVKVTKDPISTKNLAKEGTKPTVKMQGKKSISVKTGKSFDLVCEISGSPQPNVKWLHNGIQFSSSTLASSAVSKISIPAAKDSDAGAYQCVASNESGETKVDFNVEVVESSSSNEKPVLVRKLENTEVKEGKSVKLSAKLASPKKVKAMWLLNGQDIVSGENGIKLTGTEQLFTLNISSANFDKHTGCFEFVAENDAGSVTSTCQLKVLAKPRIQQELADMFISPGSSITLECHFIAQSTPKAVWYRNGTRIFQVRGVKSFLDEKIAKLEITTFTGANAGTYMVKLTNNEGEISSSCKVDVYRQPTFKKHLNEKIEEIEGKPLTLECCIEGVSESDIVWYHEETVLSPKLYNFSKNSVASIKFEKCTFEMEGTYTCVASHGGGSALSTCKVNVSLLPEIQPIRFCESLELVSNDSLLLSVKVLGKPVPNLQWFFKDSQIVEKSGVKISQNNGVHQLQIESVPSSGGGDYLCVAKNSAGFSKLSCHVSVVASGKTAQFSKTLENLITKEGESLAVEINFNAFGTFTSRWFADNHEIKETQSVKIAETPTSSILSIDNVDRCWSGSFLFEVVNRFGRSATSCVLSVLYRPIFLKQLDSDVYINRNSPLTLETEFEANPSPAVIWKFENEPIKMGPQYKIHTTENKSVVHISEPVSGKITCCLENEISNCQSTCQIVVMDLPKFDRNLTDCEVKQNDDVTLECSVVAFPPPEITWYLNDEKLDQSDSSFVQMYSENVYTLLVKNASKSSSGVYKILASNQAGVNAQSCTLKVCDIPEITCLKSIEEEITVEENDEFELDFSIKLNSDPVIQWFFDDQPLANSIRIQTKFRAGIAKLYITKCTAEDSGEYTIVVKSASDGTRRSQKVFVQVYTKPHFQVPLKKTMKVITQQELVLECKVLGFPEPMLFWYHDGEIIEEDERLNTDYENGIAMLKISSCFLEDSGVYLCKAINTVATTTCSCDVNIYSFPEFERQLSDIVVEKGKNIELTCKILAHPPPSVKWYQKGRELRNSNDIHVSHSGDEFFLVIKNSKFSHAADYSCKATNIVGEAVSKCYVEVGTLPTFKQELKKMIDVISGAKMTLQVEYSSRPAPTVKWFRDGTQLAEEDEVNCVIVSDNKSLATLSYDPVDIDQQGLYECIVENIMSSTKCDCRVFVYSIPKFSEKLLNLEIVENEDLVLKCQVIGHPEPKVGWSFNQKELDDLSNEECDLEYDNGLATLKIPAVKRNYTGTFSCKAFNSAGEATCECNIEVTVPPTFIKFPSKKDVEIDLGDNFEIAAVFEGIPLPSVSWFKNESRLEQNDKCSIYVDETQTRIKIADCQELDSAVYKCCLTNKLSTLSRHVNIIVLSPPMISYDGSEVNLKSGQKFSLKLIVTGSPKPSIACTYDTKLPISKMPNTKLLPDDFSLEFFDVTSKLAGLYTFSVENNSGKSSLPIKVNVLTPPTFAKPLENQKVNIGDDLYLLVTLNDCFPVPDLLWKHNDLPLMVSEQNGVLMRSDGHQHMLIRENISFEFYGDYTCEVMNSEGSCQSGAKITVEELLVKPKIEKLIRDITIDETKDVEIVCHFVGSPKPLITWTKDSEPISVESKAFQIGRAAKTATLKIKSAKLSHTGNYNIKLSNKVGECQSIFKVFVRELIIKPKITEALKDVSSIEFETIELVCGFEAKPPPEITWYFNNVAITKTVKNLSIQSGPYQTKLKLENVAIKRSGAYKCRIKNKGGMTSSSCKVDIEVKPIPPSLVMDDVMDVTQYSDITMKCLIEGNPFPSVKWTYNDKIISDTKYYEMFVNSGGVACLGIQEVQLTDAGVYQCIAANAYGEARKTLTLSVHRKPTKPEFKKPLTNKIVREGQPSLLTCEVTGYPEPQISCFHEGYLLESDSHAIVSYTESLVNVSIEKTELDHAGVYLIKASNEIEAVSCKAKLTVQAAPKTKPVFESDTNRCEGFEGDSVTLAHKVSAHPVPVITWLLDGRRIVSSKNQELKFINGIASLTLKKLMKTHAGEYTCIATNSEGEARESCTLLIAKSRRDEESSLNLDSINGSLVALAPQVVKGLRDIVCQESQNVTIDVKFVASSPEVIWKLNDTVVRPSDDFIISNNDSSSLLQMKNMKVKNEGKVSVLIRNQLGECESSCQVSVGHIPQRSAEKVPPHFIKKLEDIDVEDGSRVVLETKVGGPEPIEVHWLFGGEELQSHGDFKITYQFGVTRLEIVEVFPEDCGDYICLARNEFGHAKTECFVNVIDYDDDNLKSSEDSPNGSRTPEKPILIKELPEELVVVDGDPCILEVKIKCFPEPTITWLYNGEIIENNDYLSSSFAEGIAQLKFEDVYPTDAGVYECRVQNDLGVASTCCQLSIDEEMKTEEILIQLQQSLSNENFRGIKSPSRNSSGSIRESPSSNTMSSLNVHQWTIDKSLKMRKQVGKPALLVGDLQEDEFIPAISSIKSDKPPFLVKKLRDLNVEHAEAFKMECKLSHRSDAEVAWFLNRCQIKSNDNILISCEDKIALFEVLKATPELNGEIACKAINQAGEISSRCQIKVFPKLRVPPSFNTELVDLTCEEQDNMTLQCELECDSETEVEWYFNDRALPKFSKDIKMTFENSVAKLEIMSAMVLDSGRYTCEAFNSVGESYSWCDVCVQEVVSGLSPLFIDKLVNTTVMEGSPCELVCSLQEHRGVEIKWLLNGKVLNAGKDVEIVQNGNVLKVIIAKTRIANAGKYTCKAIGRTSSTWTGCELTVGGVPKFVSKLENSKIQLNDELYLHCEVSGHPIPSVAWFHNKKPVKFIRSISCGFQASKVWLRTEKVDMKLAGEYMCKISNSFGEAVTSCEIGVGASPGFLEELEDIMVVTDKPFQLVAEIHGVPVPYIEWYHPDEHTRLKVNRNVKTKFINGTATLLVDRATEEMAGVYHCKAINSFGKAVSTCKVTLGSLPEILANIDDQHVTVGESAKFECIFSSETKPIVVWLRDGCNVASNEGIQQYVGPDWASLTIDQCFETQAGEYICKVVNDFGEVISKAVLEVGAPANFVRKPRDVIKISEGRSLKLIGEIEGTPFPTIEWMFNDNLLSDACPQTKASNRDNMIFLDIDCINYNFAGKYTCIIRNNFGQQEFTTKIIVGCSPEFATPFPSQMRINIGDALVLRCEYSAFPEPEVFWFKDKRQIAEKLNEVSFSMLQENVCEMIVANAKAGLYTVKLKNNYGEVSGDCKVEVGGKPKVVKALKNDRIMEGTNWRLACEFSAVPEAQFTWIINSIPISKYSRDHKLTSKDGKVTLEIHRMTSSHFGEHVVKAVNMFGETTTKAEIENAALPKSLHSGSRTLEKFDSNSKEKRDSKFNTIARTPAKSSSESLFSEQKLSASDDVSKVLSKAPLAKTASSDLSSKNENGEKESSKPKPLERRASARLSKPTFKVDLPNSVEVKTGESLSLFCSVADTGSNPVDVAWYHNGITIKPYMDVSLSQLGNEFSLSIKNCKTRHSGKYEIKISNKAGQNTSSTIVTVKNVAPTLLAKSQTSLLEKSHESSLSLSSESDVDPKISKKPSFTKKLSDVRLFGGDNLKLECSVSGYPEPSIKWFRDSQRLPEFTSINNGKVMLEIPNVNSLQAGIYMVKAINSAGAASCTCRVTITETLKRRNSLLSRSKPTLLEPHAEKSTLAIKQQGKSSTTLSKITDSPGENRKLKTNLEEKSCSSDAKDSEKINDFPRKPLRKDKSISPSKFQETDTSKPCSKNQPEAVEEEQSLKKKDGGEKNGSSKFGRDSKLKQSPKGSPILKQEIATKKNSDSNESVSSRQNEAKKEGSVKRSPKKVNAEREDSNKKLISDKTSKLETTEKELKLNYAKSEEIKFDSEKITEYKLQRSSSIKCEQKRCHVSVSGKCTSRNPPDVLLAPVSTIFRTHTRKGSLAALRNASQEMLERCSSLDESDQCSTPTDTANRSSLKKGIG